MSASQRSNDRKAVGLLVQLKHPDVGTFAEEWATNLSPGGMFIRSRKPQPVGTPVRFEVQIAGGVRVMKGTAVVRWVRPEGDAGGPPGMGVKFTAVDAPTRALIDRMLAGRKARPEAPGEPELPAEPELPPEVAALESELRARYGAPPGKEAASARPPSVPSLSAPLPSVAPVSAPLPSVAPMVSPAAATARAARPAPAAPLVPPPPSSGLDALFDDVPPPEADVSLEDLATPVPAAAPRPLAPPPPEVEVDISVDELVAGTPPPEQDEEEPLFAGAQAAVGALPLELLPVQDVFADEPAPEQDGEDVSLELGEGPMEGASELDALLEPEEPEEPEEVVAGVVLEEEDPFALHTEEAGALELELAPAPGKAAGAVAPPMESPLELELAPAPSAPVHGGRPSEGRSGNFELEFDDGAGEEPLELDLDRGGAGARRAASLTPPPRPPPARPPSRPTPAPVAASVAAAVAPPAPVAPAAGLPSIRRDSQPPAPVAPAVLREAEATPRPAQRRDGPQQPVFLQPPAQLPSDGLVIGIDLGTTNSCVAVLQNSRPAVLRSKDGYNTVPSVVSLTDKARLLVGHRAKSQLLLNPQHTIVGAKRLVGRQFDTPVVQQVREHFHYDICPDAAGHAAVQLREHVLSLEEVQGLVLRECKEMAEQQLGRSVGRAVVTVPAYYSEPQREAVRKAGAMAGLKVERILNEPTAAALAYGLNRELNKKVLVYDLGGGTFDATVMRIEKNVFEVLATGGDTFLGGVDFDNALVDHLLQRFQEQEKVAFSGDSVALSRVVDAAERAKMALSERATAEVDIPMLMFDAAGTPRHMRLTLTREQLNEVCGHLVSRTLDVVRDVLLDAKLKPSEVEDVILVGGQSRMPLVRERLKELFGRVPQASVNADEAVALGAALYSGTVDKVSSVVLVDVLPMTVGIGLPGGVFQRVLERNTPLPAQRSFLVATQKDHETALEFSVFQGEDAHVASNEYLGTVRMEGLPRAPRGVVKVAVTLRLDTECVLHVEARDMSTRREVKATLATRYTPGELQQQLRFTAGASGSGAARRREELRQRGGRFWGLVKRAFGRKG